MVIDRRIKMSESNIKDDTFRANMDSILEELFKLKEYNEKRELKRKKLLNYLKEFKAELHEQNQKN